jgi:hypothetical protein
VITDGSAALPPVLQREKSIENFLSQTNPLQFLTRQISPPTLALENDRSVLRHQDRKAPDNIVVNTAEVARLNRPWGRHVERCQIAVPIS